LGRNLALGENEGNRWHVAGGEGNAVVSGEGSVGLEEGQSIAVGDLGVDA